MTAKGTVQYPWQRVLRTIVQVGIPAFLVFNLVVPQVIEALGGLLPPDAILWLNGVAALIAAIAAALTRIMAIPAINALLTSIGLGTQPKAAA
jgi:hypothetical protein